MIKTWGLRAALVLGLSALCTTEAAAQGRGGGMFGGRGSIANLLANEGVQKELKLDADQITKAGELAEKSREKMREAFSTLQGLDQQERMQKAQELNREINASAKKEASEFLKADQLARLTQIDLQNRGPAVYNDPEVQAKLKITDEQKASIKEVIAEAAEEMRSIVTNSGGNRQEAMAKITELQKSTKEKIEGKLTDEQKKVWKEMIGAPLEVKFAPRPRREN